jgi:uncharacterized protein DUF732
MRSKNVVAAVVVAMGVGVGLGTAVAIPAHADPSDAQLDKAFLDAIQKKGVPVKSNQDALDLAHSTCDLLSRGGSVTDALMHIKNVTDHWSNDQITAFGGVAVQAYCPNNAPK